MNENKNEISQLKAENQLLQNKINELTRSSEQLRESEKLKNIVFDISKAVHKTDDLFKLSKLIHHNLQKVLNADNFFVALYNEESGKYRFPYFVDSFDNYDNTPMDLTNTLTDYVRKTGKPLFADDAVHKKLHIQEGINYVGTFSFQWLGAPLRVEDKVLGVVVIQEYSEDILYKEDDLAILDFIADNISFLILKKINYEKISNSLEELEQKIVQRNRELESLNKQLAIDIKKREEAEKVQNALYRISKSANKTEELNDLYGVIHNIIKSLMPAENFYIAQIDEDNQLITFPYYIDEFDNQPLPIPLSLNTLTSFIIRTGKSLILNSETNINFFQENNIVEKGAVPKLWVGVPLMVKGKCIGAMVLQDYHSSETYFNKDKEILTFVSNQVARTIKLKKDEIHINDIMCRLYKQKWALQDTTKKLEKSNEELTLSEKQLKKLLLDKDKFFSIIAHDLKSPLQSLLGNIEYLRDEFEEMDKSESEIFVNNTYKSAKSLYSLIENLLEWSRIQLEKLELNIEAFKISDLIDKVVAQLENLILSKNIELVIEIDDSQNLTSDKNILEIIIRNILSNAIKFSYENSKIIIQHFVSDQMINISFRDFGIGMCESVQEKLFCDSETISTNGTKNEKGTGLGLMLCKELIEELNGTIEISSEVKKGSIFTIKFPVIDSIKDLKIK